MSNEQTAAIYIGKGVQLLETACKMYHFCDGCLLRNIETGKCAKEELQTLLTINSQ